MMPLNYAVIGNFSVDNIVSADGIVSLQKPGGNALHSAIGVHIWGHHPGIVSLIPRNYPERWLRLLQAAGMSTDGIQRAPIDVEREEWFIYRPDGSRIDRLFAAVGQFHGLLTGRKKLGSSERRELLAQLQSTSATGTSFASFRQQNPLHPGLIPSAYRPIQACHLAPNDYETQLNMARSLRKHGTLITLDPTMYSRRPDHEQLVALLGLIDVFMPSEKEMAMLFPQQEFDDIIRFLAPAGLRAIVVKEGARGCRVWCEKRDEVRSIPAFPASVVDLTGAGDSFSGGFLVGMSETRDPFQAARYGVAAASLAIEQRDLAAKLRCTRDQALKRMQQIPTHWPS